MNGKPMNLNRESDYSKMYAQLDFNTVQNGIHFNRGGVEEGGEHLMESDRRLYVPVLDGAKIPDRLRKKRKL